MVSSSRFNSNLTAARRQNLDGFYDPHTNIVQYPKITQPTHARWTQVPPAAAATPANPASTKATGNSSQPLLTNGTLTNGHDVTTDDDSEDDMAGNETDKQHPPPKPSNPEPTTTTTTTILTPVKSIYARNFLIVDTHFASPPTSNFGVPGPDGPTLDVAHQTGLADVPNDVLAELPAECAAAFARARADEVRWKSAWATEAVDGGRARFRVDYNLTG